MTSGDLEQVAPEKVQQGEEGAAKADLFMAELNKRTRELQGTGLSWRVASDMAYLEYRIAHWPPSWGDDIHVLIYGDFEAPNRELSYPALGITIEPGKRTDTIIKTALCVINARVKVSSKTVLAVEDAIARLNTLLGLWTIIDWGNRGIGWWCHLTSGTLAGVGGPFEKDGIERALAGIDRLPTNVKRRVRSALYWIQEPQHMMLEKVKNDTLAVYVGYWNAFECLVEAVCLFRPKEKMTKQDKQNGIAQFLAQRNGRLDLASLEECYRTFLNPGFVAKASHALKICYGNQATGYINECFLAKPEENRLYSVRNSINHGDIDPDNMQAMYKVDERLGRLKMIVFGMLGRVIPFAYPLDSGPR